MNDFLWRVKLVVLSSYLYLVRERLVANPILKGIGVPPSSNMEAENGWKKIPIFRNKTQSGWWFQLWFYVHPYMRNIPIWLIFFRMGWKHQPVIFHQGPAYRFSRSLMRIHCVTSGRATHRQNVPKLKETTQVDQRSVEKGRMTIELGLIINS